MGSKPNRLLEKDKIIICSSKLRKDYIMVFSTVKDVQSFLKTLKIDLIEDEYKVLHVLKSKHVKRIVNDINKHFFYSYGYIKVEFEIIREFIIRMDDYYNSCDLK